MKRFAHRFGSILLALFIIMSIAVPALAANGSNTTDNPIRNFTFQYYGYKEVDRDWKGASTPLYLYVYDIQQSVVGFYVRAVGYKYPSPTAGEEKNTSLTLSNGIFVDYVTVFAGNGVNNAGKYSIRTKLNEKGYTHAAIGFNCSSQFNTITLFSGEWSPDSAGLYNIATKI